MRVPPFLLILLVGSVPIMLVALILTVGSVELAAWRPPIIWSGQYGTSGSAFENSVNAVAADNSGAYAAGIVGAVNTPNGTIGTLFVTKFDPSGRMIWTHNQSRISFDMFDGISVGNDGVYVLGDVNGSISVFKLALTGKNLWTVQIRNGSSGVDAVYATSTGAYVAGKVDLPITGPPFTGDVMFVREYDLNGNVVWTSEFSNSTAGVEGVYVSSSGVYILAGGLLTGGFLIKYDLNGKELWNIPGGGIGISGDGAGVYVAGWTQFNRFTPPPGGFLTKYRSDGSMEWTQHFDVADHSGVSDSKVSADSSGVYLSVRSTSDHNYIFRYDSQGNQLWSFEPPLSRQHAPVFSGSIALASGEVYVGGSVSANSAGRMAYLESYTKDGSLIFFGLQPPWSFALVGGIGAFVAINIFLHVRRKRRLAKAGSKPLDRILPSGIPKDCLDLRGSRLPV